MAQAINASAESDDTPHNREPSQAEEPETQEEPHYGPLVFALKLAQLKPSDPLNWLKLG